MNSEFGEEILLRHYLLGTLDDDAILDRTELRLMTDDGFADQITIAECKLIEDYLDDSLNLDDSANFKRHFLFSPERKQQLRLTLNLRKYAAPAEREIPHAKRSLFDLSPYLSIQWLRFAALAAVVIATGLGIWRFGIYESDTEKGLAQLRSAYRGQRPSESRTSADFDYAPLSDLRGDGQTTVDERARARAERYLFDATENAADSKARHALGLYYLARKDFDKALAELNAALKLAPQNATIHTDIGAAYYEKAKRAEFDGLPAEILQNLALALESTNRALEIDKTMPHALFDQALILQKMQLPNQAREAWQKFLEIDAASPWADEARRNLESLGPQAGGSIDKDRVLLDFLDAFERKDDDRAWQIASQTKELVTGTILSSQLARDVAGGNEQAGTAKAATAFFYLGELERRNSGDPFFFELASFYKNADRIRRQKLFDAHEKLREAHELILKADFTKALVAAEHARNSFSAAGSDWEARIADHRIAYCLSQLNRIAESNDRLATLSEFCRARGYRWLEGLAEGWRGNNFSLLGERSRAVKHNQQALDIAFKVGDSCSQMKVYNQMTAEHWLIGDAARTLAAVHLSLKTSDLYFLSPRQTSRNLLFGTEALYRFKYSAAAAAFSRESIYVGDELKDRWATHAAQIQIGRIYGNAKNFQPAFEAVEKSFEMADSFDDAVMRQRQNTRSRLTLAFLQRQSGDCAAAVASYDRVISDYKEASFPLNIYEARKGRLLCLINENRDEAVATEMRQVLALFDQNRQTILSEVDRNTFSDNEQGVYDIAANYAYSQMNQHDRAFDYAENSRARSLLGRLREGHAEISGVLSLPELRNKIPADVQILYYAVMADKILIWQISSSGVASAAQPIAIDDLDDLVHDFLKTLKERGDLRERSERLYRLLIAPIENAIEPGKTVCIIADKALLRLPYGALISPTSEGYLIEKHALIFSPSASVFINETDVANQKSPVPDETLLSIGNPAFSRKEYPDMPDLPDAAREAKTIGAFYPSTKHLIGEDANMRQVVDNLRSSSVVHFAGHYMPNTKFPHRSKFLLPPDDLMVENISRENVAKVRLLVLSACDTGTGKYYRGEGMIGAARTFLTLGVPLVVASQWSVDSEATAQLMIDFHRHRKQGKLSTTAALQRSQIEMIKSEDMRFRSPFYWASFMPIGGYTTY